ncbi:adenosylcobalamin-dependent ribonucleoside-diphosphate reductase [Candidatus Pacearchaeota archaeon]|nr:adenosylcobalamin-dependent ribonucleoside-diphosphate reductase [Candidatus Pacearchaeota archaeon]
MTTTLQMPDYVNPNMLEDRLGESGVGIMEKKYLTTDSGRVQTPAERLYTISSEAARAEVKYGADAKQVESYAKKFYEMMSSLDFLPGGRVLANLGTEVKALANCYVLPVPDDLGQIYQAVAEAALVHKNGGGTGYNFSRLRPRGFKVKKGVASGPISFAGQFDKETEVINSGNRRGANMGVLNVEHPDIFDFIRAKDMYGVLRNFNISVGMSNRFMEAYERGEEYTLRFDGRDITARDLENVEINIMTAKAGSEVGKKPIPASLLIRGQDVVNCYPVLDELGMIQYSGEKGQDVLTKQEVVGRVDEHGIVKIDTKKVLGLIAAYAHKRGDPGIIFLDTIERDNLLRADGLLDATNPCGEQPLHPYDACNLGSVNLSNMVSNKGVDFSRLEQTVRHAVRFMDNVNDLNEGPIPKIEQTIRRHRRIGLGVMGWADMLMKMKIGYDSPEAYELADRVMGVINKVAKEESVKLGVEKGVFPAFDQSDYDKENPNERVRNLARTTIAPTGSIAMVAGVNSGIEPYYALTYYKEMRGGDSVEVIVPPFVEAIKEAGLDVDKIIEKVRANKGSCQGIKEIPKEIQDVFKTSMDIDYKHHIEMQAVFQRNVDNAISKTINFSSGATVENILDAYVLAHKKGCKGITVYVDGSLETQVLDTEARSDGKTNRNMRGELEQLVRSELKKPRPGDVFGRTVAVKTPYGHTAFVTFNWAFEDGQAPHPYESFVAVGKAGGDLPALAEMGGRLMSLAIKAGVDPRLIVEQLEDIGGENQTGIGENKVKSLPDAFAKAIRTALEKGPPYNAGYNGNHTNGNSEESPKARIRKSSNLCPSCQSPMIREEGCEKCSKCTYTRC